MFMRFNPERCYRQIENFSIKTVVQNTRLLFFKKKQKFPQKILFRKITRTENNVIKLFDTMTIPGSAKASGREPKTSLGRVFNNNLGCYDDVHLIMYTDAHPYL
jgi:hypothetical protein